MDNELVKQEEDRGVAPLNQESLAEYSQEQLRRNAPRLVPRALRALQKLADEKDRKAIELILQTYGFIKPSGPGGVSVITNLYNNNVHIQKEDAKATEYLEGIIVRLDREEREKANIIDAEVVK